MYIQTLVTDPSHVLKLISKIGLWTVGGYIGVLFVSPFVAAGLVQVAYLATGTRPGGTPVTPMREVPPLNSERDREEIIKRKLDTNLPLLKKVAQESVSYTSGLTAVLLQIAHPGVGKGVGRHSNFSTRLLERTQNTAIFINVMVFGTEAEKTAFRNFVTLAHQHVNGKRSGQPYDAMDPQLQLWVAATMYKTMLEKYETVFHPLSEAERDQVYQEFSTFGTVLQVPLSLWPENREAFDKYWDKELVSLRVPTEAVRVAQDLFYPRYSKLPSVLAPILFFRRPMDMAMATEELPEHVRHDFGLKSTFWTRTRYEALMAFYKLTYKVYPESVRTWQRDYYLWMMRQRFAKKGMTRNGKPISFESLEA
ncbi:hypothetical protein AJ79_02487 [Helicocarpus griseus UAMH5409]|uniref:ER-bound oxygenase mpaB/mpaB'/Rubber oxygenase catalytic domain-containing protein n=1 Tax=Helicocarpus griseus UAMH5409 TaxID=1447875 RepID=A0A2B7Y396_9EURO|nr:hypothetical protein AJ79_02487 [Helicocarpus griseus UAMH5409]